MIKKAIALFLIAGSLLFAFLILSGKNQTIELINTQTAVRSENLPQQNPAPTPARKIDENSVKEIAKGITDRSITPDKIASKILPELSKNLDLSDLNPEINAENLKIVKSSDKILAENYFKNLKEIVKNNLSVPTTDFEKLASAYKNTAAAVYSLVVPENLTEIHREELRLVVLHQKIFENLSRYKDDPLKALVSADVLQKIDPQLENLAALKRDFIKKNDLRI